MSGERENEKRERIIAIIAEQLGVPREQIVDRMPDLDGIAKYIAWRHRFDSDEKAMS